MGGADVRPTADARQSCCSSPGCWKGYCRSCADPEEDRMDASRAVCVLIVAIAAGCGAKAGFGSGAGDLEGDAGDGALLWRPTCGDPVCMAGGHRDHGVPRCTVETAGKQCG